MAPDNARAWSCSTLMRGASFLAEQQAQGNGASWNEVVGASRLQMMVAYTGRVFRNDSRKVLHLGFCGA